MGDHVGFIVVGAATVDPTAVVGSRKRWVLPQGFVLDGHNVGMRHEQQSLLTRWTESGNQVAASGRRFVDFVGDPRLVEFRAQQLAGARLAAGIWTRAVVDCRNTHEVLEQRDDFIVCGVHGSQQRREVKH